MRKLSFFIVVLAMSVPCLAFAEKVVITTGEWAPYVSEKIPGQGAATEILQSAAKAAGLELDIRFVPWARAEKEVADGTAFGAYPYVSNDERKKTYAFSDPLMTSKGMVFYMEGHGKDLAWTTLNDFGSAKFGGISGYYYMDDFKKAGIQPETANTLDQLVKMLEAGRFEYFIEDELVARTAIKALFPGETAKFKTAGKPYNQGNLAVMVSKTYPNSAALLKRLNDGLAAIRKDGSYAAILAKYGIGK